MKVFKVRRTRTPKRIEMALWSIQKPNAPPEGVSSKLLNAELDYYRIGHKT